MVILSKNDEKFIFENFLRVWGSCIFFEDFCLIKVNWGVKFDLIKEIL